MRARVSFMLGVLCAAALAAPRAGAADQKAEEAATARAEEWLALVDQGKYAESWDEAAALFKAAVTKEKWPQALTAARAPLGKLVSRTLESRQYAASLPGAPDGKYVVIQYDSVFENKKVGVETVTPMLDTDGRWRVSGYFVR